METIWNTGITWNIFLQNLGSWLKTPMEVFSFFGTEYFFLLLLPALYWCLEDRHWPTSWHYPSFEHFG